MRPALAKLGPCSRILRGFCVLPVLVLSFSALALTACGEPGGAAGAGRPGTAAERRVTVGAASSLRELLEGTAPLFRPPGAPVAVRLSFEASSTLARQIAEGAPYDVFLSADEASLDRLGDRVVAESRRVVLSNRLVLVGRPGLLKPPTELSQLAARLAPHGEIPQGEAPLRLVLAGPEVPAGKYARALLERAGLLEAVTARAAIADNVRAALALVATGAVDCGFVYATDAAVAPDVAVLWTAPSEALPPIRYAAAVVAGSPSPWADAYLDFLGSEEFLREAEALGFLRAAP